MAATPRARKSTRKPTGTARTTRKSQAKPTARRRSTPRAADGIALLKQDHRTVEQLFKRFQKLGARATKSKAGIIRRIVRELSIHAAIEEQILYPTLEKEAPRGKQMASEALEEHREAKEVLSELDGMSPEDERFDEMVSQLIVDVRHHVKEEEGELFPRLRESVDRDTLKQMGEQMRAAKKIAPTRPHPKAPDRPPANVVAGVVAGVVDRVRDLGRTAMQETKDSS
jgi:hemerythrin superfamily protein